METIDFTIQLPVYPERVCRAWLDSYEHGRFTGSFARITPHVGGSFLALDGKVESQLLALSPFDHIAQSWKITGEAEEAVMRLDLFFAPTCTGCEMKVHLENIPDGYSRDLMRWWEDVYLRPFSAYLDALVGEYPADEGDG